MKSAENGVRSHPFRQCFPAVPPMTDGGAKCDFYTLLNKKNVKTSEVTKVYA